MYLDEDGLYGTKVESAMLLVSVSGISNYRQQNDLMKSLSPQSKAFRSVVKKKSK